MTGRTDPAPAVPACAIPASAVPASAVPATAVPATTLPGRAATVDLPSLLPSSLLDEWHAGGPAGAGDPRPRPHRTVRDWIIDVLCFLVSLVGGGLVLIDTHARHVDRPVLVADLAVGFGCCVAVWWRRRWPVTMAVVMIPVTAFSAASQVAAAVLMFTVAVHRRAQVAVAVSVASLTTMPVFYWWRTSRDESFWLNMAIGVLLSAVLLGWGMFIRARRQLIVSLQDRAARAEAEQQLRVDQARRAERTRIAREMHDVLAHRLSLLSMHAGALEFRADAAGEQVASAAGVIRANAHQALEELREVISLLREEEGAAGTGQRPEPPQLGLAEIPALVRESTQAGTRVRYACALAAADAVPASVARTAYRVVQEGLTNARKHAPGAAIDVAISADPDGGLQVQVRNPAPTWPPPADTVPGAGLGLVGLTERVQLGGGRLEHGRDDAGQFLLRARLPWSR